MTVSADEITNKTFDTKMRGFNQSEVRDYLNQVAQTVQELNERNRELSEMVRANEEKLKYFTDLKDSLNKSILVAQEAADKVKNNAKKEAEIMVREAQKQATDIVSEANEKANSVIEECTNSTRKLTTETNDLKKQTRIFRQRLQVMLESQLEVVKSNDWDELLANTDMSDFTEIQKILGNKVDNPQASSVNSDTIPDENTTSSVAADQPAAGDEGETVVIFPDSDKSDH
ncbi:DivIVA domain-containing protein [uncultured Limosilactobacillus sp.]|uniref:DivIVA domain-containing protein n=1 Tax=uncultured Limosilactobacillus sp. TaxID=2837629 RepID=UPI0025CF311A|nr:DivIVA domain-containing protein [uncultured Limosilactobacillus sp.]